jgi:hypothetical protein
MVVSPQLQDDEKDDPPILQKDVSGEMICTAVIFMVLLHEAAGRLMSFSHLNREN